MRITSTKMLVICVALMSTIVGLSWVEAYYEKAKAQELLVILGNVVIGENSDLSLPELRKNFGAFMDIDKGFYSGTSTQGH